MPRPMPVPDPESDPAGEEETPSRRPRIVEVDYEGHTYAFDADEVSIDALEDFENQKYLRAIRSILGADQWAEYKRRNPRAVDLDRFMAALLRATGAAGNSSASSAS